VNAPDDKVQRLNDQLIADRQLRDRFRRDPVAVVEEEFEIELTDEQREKFLSEEWLEKTEEEILSMLHDEPGIFSWF
jgi:hypothetical protein